MRNASGLLAVALWVALAGCSKGGSEQAASGAPAPSGRVTALGSSTVVQVVKPLIDAFQKVNPKISIEPESSNSNWGLGALRGGMNDIALSTKGPSPDDKHLVAHAIARDGLCVIVHKDNPVQALTDDQLKGIFEATIKNWKEVGGSDAPIERLNHAEVRISLEMFVKYLGIQVSDIKYSESVIAADAGAVGGVANQTNAVTYVSIASALNAVAEGKAIKLIGLKGVPPTVANVENGTVPVVYDINLVTKDKPTPQTQAFIDFATSSAAADIIKAKNFAPKK